MTKTNKKEYLRQARGLDEVIRSNQLELEELQALSTSISVSDCGQERVKNSLSGHDAHFTQVIDQLMDLEDKIKHDTFRILNLKREIRENIQAIDNYEERLVLQNKYLLGMSWEKVSEELHVSIATVYRVHDAALESLKI
ncbi:MAG: DUF1492 domain-containing protein [Eubacteriales bacterium]